MDSSEFKKIIVSRIQTLSDTKNLIDWSSGLNEFFILYKSHSLLQPIFEKIFRKKAEDYESYFNAYDAFSQELSDLFEALQRELLGFIALPIFPWEILNKQFSMEKRKNKKTS